MNSSELIWDWNQLPSPKLHPSTSIVEIHDETLRDGIQSPSVSVPALDDQLKLIHLMNGLGINSACLGYPSASVKAFENVIRLAKEISQSKLAIRPGCSGRTVLSDIQPIVDVAQATGKSLEAFLFIGSSPIRQLVEKWDIATMAKGVSTAISFATQNQLSVTFVTEDTTRSKPEHLETLFLEAIDSGASRLCICDTVGHATPLGVRSVIQFTKNLLDQRGLSHIGIDFHGHMDRGLGVWNSIEALNAGANRVHGCGLGVGERAGNTPIELLLVNLKLMGRIHQDLSLLCNYSEMISKSLGIPIASTFPVIGRDAFETATGVHAAAILKAQSMSNDNLADLIYSSVPARWVGKSQSIRLGPMSGKACAKYWLQSHGHPISDRMMTELLDQAKKSNRLMTHQEILKFICTLQKTSVQSE